MADKFRITVRTGKTDVQVPPEVDAAMKKALADVMHAIQSAAGKIETNNPTVELEPPGLTADSLAQFLDPVVGYTIMLKLENDKTSITMW